MVALLAITLQLIAIFAPLGSDDLPHRILFITSYVLLLVFVSINVRHPGIVILGLGLTLNLLAIVMNGGLMATTPETYAKFSWPEDVRVGERIPYTKDILLEREDVHLYVLSDRYRWDVQTLIRVFSVGDVIIVAGLIVTVGELALPRYGRKPA
ncbi:MAG: DUF5317 family protein [Cytophagales bacterium]|nr:DUF5317 family protein [Armatimonadota bacterium]